MACLRTSRSMQRGSCARRSNRAARVDQLVHVKRRFAQSETPLFCAVMFAMRGGRPADRNRRLGLRRCSAIKTAQENIGRFISHHAQYLLAPPIEKNDPRGAKN